MRIEGHALVAVRLATGLLLRTPQWALTPIWGGTAHERSGAHEGTEGMQQVETTASEHFRKFQSYTP